MEKEFVPYKPSLRLKALGFDEPCFGYYGKGVLSIEIIKSGKIFTNEDSIYFDKDSSCLAPTFSQAFRWFRENHDLLGIPTHSKFTIMSNKWVGQPLYGNYNSYEEAELACLNKLIEIVETKSE